MKTRELSDREGAALTAGLRLVQQRLDPTPNGEDVDEILTMGKTVAPLTVDEINQLCEAINQYAVVVTFP